MNATQVVIEWMTGLNIGAVLFEGDYRFPRTFHQDPVMAERFVAKYLSGDRDGSDAMDYCLDVSATKFAKVL
jgi:hypothetical protein